MTQTQNNKVNPASIDATDKNDDVILSPSQAQVLLEAGVHFGQPLSQRSPSMDKYVFGIARNGMQIIDLDKTWQQLHDVCKLLKQLSSDNKNIVFVGTNKSVVSKVLLEFAEKYNLNYINSRWLGGTLTNPITRSRINHLRELEALETGGLLELMPSKEKSFTLKKLKKLRKSFGGLKTIKGAIHCIVIIDPQHEEIATLEALKCGKSNNTKIVAITDTDCKFDSVNFSNIITANVSSIRSLRVILEEVSKPITEGRKFAAEKTRLQAEARKAKAKPPAMKKQAPKITKVSGNAKPTVEENKPAPAPSSIKKLSSSQISGLPKKQK